MFLSALLLSAPLLAPVVLSLFCSFTGDTRTLPPKRVGNVSREGSADRAGGLESSLEASSSSLSDSSTSRPLLLSTNLSPPNSLEGEAGGIVRVTVGGPIGAFTPT